MTLVKMKESSNMLRYVSTVLGAFSVANMEMEMVSGASGSEQRKSSRIHGNQAGGNFLCYGLFS
ncbi:hypothetical protein [Neobacillus sp. 19]|uniref:hypothetical protein n=1 Tax=Neobacillus sp. 19 TaxID=3394458 RepID=UPI003BF6FD2D